MKTSVTLSINFKFYFTPLFVRWGDNECFGTVGANGPTAPAPDDR